MKLLQFYIARGKKDKESLRKKVIYVHIVIFKGITAVGFLKMSWGPRMVASLK